jgi:hypothetical protein
MLASHVLGHCTFIPALAEKFVKVCEQHTAAALDDFCWDAILPWGFTCGQFL